MQLKRIAIKDRYSNLRTTKYLQKLKLLWSTRIMIEQMIITSSTVHNSCISFQVFIHAVLSFDLIKKWWMKINFLAYNLYMRQLLNNSSWITMRAQYTKDTCTQNTITTEHRQRKVGIRIKFYYRYFSICIIEQQHT